MALFSRRKKSVDQPDADQPPADGDTLGTDGDTLGADGESASSSAPGAEPAAAERAEPVPDVSISVQAFRGVGAAAGPEVDLADDDAASGESPAASHGPVPSPAAGAAVPAEGMPRLPLAPPMPPEQTHTVDGLIDNVLLRETLGELQPGATNEQLLGVMRQSLQGHLYLRVHGDAREQISSGQPLSIGVVRDGERSFLLAFSSGRALQQSLEGVEDAASTSAIAQPVVAVYQQVIAGGFDGIIIDNASAPHRAVFPKELLQKAVEQADEAMTIKTAVAAARDDHSRVRVAEALATARCWVAVNSDSDGKPTGIAEAHTADGRRFLQVFSHPLEVVVLRRDDQPMPFRPDQLAKILAEHADIAGVVVDIAGPSITIERDSLGAVLSLAPGPDGA